MWENLAKIQEEKLFPTPFKPHAHGEKKSEKEIFMLNTCHNNGYADNYPCYMAACTASCKQHRSIALG